MIKKAQMMLQASIGRTAENAEIEQLEATIESAKNLGLPSEGLFILSPSALQYIHLLSSCVYFVSHLLDSFRMLYLNVSHSLLHSTNHLFCFFILSLDRSDYGTSPQPGGTFKRYNTTR